VQSTLDIYESLMSVRNCVVYVLPVQLRTAAAWAGTDTYTRWRHCVRDHAFLCDWLFLCYTVVGLSVSVRSIARRKRPRMR